jgi:hypothetical protein
VKGKVETMAKESARGTRARETETGNTGLEDTENTGSGENDESIADHDALPQLPAGYESKSADAVGVWNSRNRKCSRTLHFIPREANIIDNNVTPSRASIFVIGELVEPCTVEKTKDGDEIVRAKAGDLVGVWYSPGMRGLETMLGVKTFIFFEKEVEMKGGRNPMRKYCVAAPKRAPGSKEKDKLIPIRGDYRKQSKGTPTVFDDPNADTAEGSGAAPF